MKKIILVMLFVASSLVADDFNNHQKEVMAKAIRMSGYECNSVNSAYVSYSSGGIVISCDGFSHSFDLIRTARTWIIKERR